MVEDRVTLLKYLPLAVAGLSRCKRAQQRDQVLLELGGLEADLADRGVDDAGLVGAELDTTGLALAHGGGDVHRHGPDLGVGHQVARSEHPTEAADEAHHVGGGDGDVEVEPAVLDLLDDVLGADKVGPGLGRLHRPVALGEHEHADGLAGPVGQRDGRTDHLVGVARVDAESGRTVDALVELGEADLFDQRHSPRSSCSASRGPAWPALLGISCPCSLAPWGPVGRGALPQSNGPSGSPEGA